MAEHTIKLEVDIKDIGNNNIKMVVKEDGDKFGTVEIGKGGVKYYPSGFDASNPHVMNWKDFDELMKTKPRIKDK